MTQNIYDQKNFFEEYIQLPRQVHGLDGATEWPVLRSLVPDIRGAKVLDLGCGFGWHCRWARENGANEVLGVDVSENMLAKAKTFPQDPAINYLRADLETLELPANTYQVAISSLALHYLTNLSRLVAQVYQALTPGGSFIFSAEHPIYTSPRHPKFIKDSEGHDVWQLDAYLYEGPRTTNVRIFGIEPSLVLPSIPTLSWISVNSNFLQWLAEGVVKQHRTIATYISILLDAGFTLSAINEWGPAVEMVKQNLSWAENRERPIFFFIKVTKPN
jgi:SAM-dependent methyltransferase